MLPPGYRFEEYEIVRVLGQGGFAITYLAKDHYRDQEVALKEYFPTGYAVRASGMRVGPAPGSRETFDWGFRRFLDEARVQAKFRHPNIPVLHRYFRTNGTAYVAMEYVKGSSLSDVLASRGSLPLAKWRPWVDRLLDALEHVHGHDYLHRDITPRNILIRETDDQPVLIDFGAARIATEERTRTVVLTEAYAPMEQHSKRAKQGPFTDIYSLAAVSYRVLSGKLPPSAPDRAVDDELVPLARRVTKAPEWMAAVDRALATAPRDRPKSAAVWRKELNEAAAKMWLHAEPNQALARDADGSTALHRAAAGEPLPEVVALLLDDGADIHAATKDGGAFEGGDTPLHRAAAANPNPDVTKLLLDRGADVYSKNVFSATPLHLAAWENANAAVASVLLDRGASVTSQDSAGATPLHRAVQAEASDVVELLLKRGADPKNPWSDPFSHRALLRLASANHEDVGECVGTTPLHIAAEKNAVRVMTQLLDRGADADARDDSGGTPLHLAAQHNALGTLQLLLESDANPRAQDLAGFTPLHRAAWGNALATARHLLRTSTVIQSDDECRTKFWMWESGISVESIVRTLCAGKRRSRRRNYFREFRASWSDLRPVAEMLLHKGNTPLHWAAFGNSRDVAKLLLDEGADVHDSKSEGPTPLDLAALGNATDTARLLVDHGADVSGCDDYPATPLHWAALGDACETMALLIDRGADAGARRPRWTPMFFAALGNARKAMELLLAEGAELGPHNTSGSVVSPWGDWRETREGFVALDRESDTDTLLHWASLRDATDVVELLLDRGTDLEAEDGEGRTPLDYAAQGNAVGAVERLLDRGADIGASGRMGYTPLHSAARANATDAAQLLLERGAEVQAGQSDVGTPLHMAQSAEIASLLLDRDADIEATDRDGNTPLRSAALRNTADVVDVLLNQGARLQRSVAAIDAPGVHSEAVESFRIHPRSSVRQLFSGK